MIAENRIFNLVSYKRIYKAVCYELLDPIVKSIIAPFYFQHWNIYHPTTYFYTFNTINIYPLSYIFGSIICTWVFLWKKLGRIIEVKGREWKKKEKIHAKLTKNMDYWLSNFYHWKKGNMRREYFKIIWFAFKMNLQEKARKFYFNGYLHCKE